MTRTLMIAGGGTGGHIYPAIAIAQEWMSRGGERRVVFVGPECGLEKTIVPKAGFPLEFISAGGLRGRGGVDLLRTVARLPFGFVQAAKLVRKHHPSVVLGVGSYSSGPVLAAAKLSGRPTAIHEANAFPGLANRVLGRFMTAVAVAFPDAAPRLKRNDAVVTGNPIRKEFFEAGERATAGGERTSETRTAKSEPRTTATNKPQMTNDNRPPPPPPSRGPPRSHATHQALSGGLRSL